MISSPTSKRSSQAAGGTGLERLGGGTVLAVKARGRRPGPSPCHGLRGWVVGALAAALAASAAAEQTVRNRAPIYATWETFTTVQGLPDNRVRSVICDSGTVWVGTDEGLARLQDGSWKAWTSTDGLPPFPIQSIVLDALTGDLWLGTFGGGLVRMSGGRFHAFNQFNSGLAGDVVFDVQGLENRVWAATNGGLSGFCPVQDEWKLYRPRTANADEPVIAALKAVGGKLIALEWQGRAFWLDETRDVFLPLMPRPIGSEFKGTALAEHVDRLFLASRNGHISRMASGADPGSEHVSLDLARRRYCPREAVLTIEAQTSDVVWVGTSHQLHQVDLGHLELTATYRSLDGTAEVVLADGRAHGLRGELPPGPLRAIAFDDSGIWVGTDHGLARGAIADLPTSPGEAAGLQANAAMPKTAAPSALGKHTRRAAIAVHGPYNRTISLPADPGDAARTPRADLLAVELALQSRRHNEIPMEILTPPSGYARYGWGLPEDEVTGLVLDPRIVAMMGAVAADHSVLAAVAANSKVAWLDISAPSDRDLGPAGPASMVFRCWGDAPRRHRVVFDHAIRHAAAKRVALIGEDDPQNYRPLLWWRDYARVQNIPIAIEALVPSDPSSDRGLFEDGMESAVDIIFFAGSRESARKLLRTVPPGTSLSVVTGPLGAELEADEVPRGVRVIALLSEAAGHCAGGHSDFIDAYKSRGPSGAGPDKTAIRSLHAAQHLIAVTESAGPSRQAVRDRLEELDNSCFGERHFEESHAPGPVWIAEFADGQWQSRQLPVP